MSEISGSETNQKLNFESDKIKQNLIAQQADGNIYQYSGVTFNETKIIQSSFEEIKHREFISTSPYKGLKKFDCEDKDLFFGRDQFLTGLVNELEQSNLILLMGASGSGKSSVIRAGLIPWLAQKWGLRFVKIIFTPDRDPFDSFYASLLSKYKQADAQIAREAKADTLHRVITQLKQPDEYWLIAIDQFEELFTTTQGDKRDLFINSLVHLNKTQLNAVKIIGTMRADFLDKLSPHPKLAKITDKHRPLIAEMQPDELRLAIEQPAAHHGVLVNPELVQEILKDIQGQAGYLPLLQYTLNLLWETELKQNLIQERTLNLATYRQLGRVQGALQQHVNTLYEALSLEEKQATQRIFLKLVDIGQDAASGSEWKPVRRRVSKSIFTSELEQQVLLKLINENLLVSDFSPETQESTIDITHEILLTSWTQLHEWIKENREAIAIRNRLNYDMSLCKGKKKSEDELWSGSKLEQVLELRKDPNFNQVLGGFSREENEFIDLSLGLRDSQRRKSNRRLARLCLFFFILAGGAGWQWRLAEISKRETIVRNSQLLFNQGQNFDALIEILRVATPFKNAVLTGKPPLSVHGTLIDAVYAKKEYKRLEGHQESVNSIVFSPDGKTLASSSGDKTIKLWNVETGEEIHTLAGHQDKVWSIAFSPDGKTLASSSYDKTIKLWNVETGKEIHTFTRHQHSVATIRFSPDGKTLASSSIEDKTISLWNVETGEIFHTLIGHHDQVWRIAFSPEGNILASGSKDKTIKIWNVETGEEIHTLTGHQDLIWRIAFSPDGATLASGSMDNMIKLWNVETGKNFYTLTGHQHLIWSLAFHPDGKTLASGSGDKTIKLWNVETGKEIYTLTGHDEEVKSIAFSPDGNTLASGSVDNSIKLWNVETGEEIHTLTGHQARVLLLAFTPDGKTLASMSDDNSIKLWTVEIREEIHTLMGHQSWVNSIAFSPDGNTLASGSVDNSIKLWNVEAGEEIHTLTGHQEQVSSIAFSPDGNTLASGSGDNSIKLWNVETGEEIHTLTGHQEWVYSIAFSPDGNTLASGSGDNSIKLWNVETGEEIHTLTGHQEWVYSIAFSPDGNTLASGSVDNSIKLWNVETGEKIHTLTGHQEQVSSIAFSPDGNTLASGSGDNSIKLWNVETGEEIHTLTGHQESVYSIAFSPDGHTLASGSRDKSIKLWNVETGEEIQTLSRHQDRVESISFSPDGKTLASGSGDKTIKLWDVETGKEIPTLSRHQGGVDNIAFRPQDNTLAFSAGNTIHIWNINFEELLKRGCKQVYHYLKTSPNVSKSDRKMCNGIVTNQ
ncbi:WD40 repeat domain-containing protein [Laspinema sp. A4]|uniref:NACHT and WD repeat domain-containing protein n=1 Tax=Laspinema sp. D2d TaxID=2953686 RepID=UPI0021BAE9E9|nr:WD40 repeat domain-containing protein [Laspinema sp. D2d]MCT7984068.1 WD40 repeat domain-containing protein [Laspinema sp. D2d]